MELVVPDLRLSQKVKHAGGVGPPHRERFGLALSIPRRSSCSLFSHVLPGSWRSGLPQLYVYGVVSVVSGTGVPVRVYRPAAQGTVGPARGGNFFDALAQSLHLELAGRELKGRRVVLTQLLAVYDYHDHVPLRIVAQGPPPDPELAIRVSPGLGGAGEALGCRPRGGFLG